MKFQIGKSRWVVIGGGVSGISAVGRLISCGHSVTWIDEDFRVGRMGKYYQTVPANTTNGALSTALSDCSKFDFHGFIERCRKNGKCSIFDLPGGDYSSLENLVGPLQHATYRLREDLNVRSISGTVLSTRFRKVDGLWYTDISIPDSAQVTVESDAVIIATGSSPTEWHDKKISCYNLDDVICSERCKSILMNRVAMDMPWAVVGGSHRSVIVSISAFPKILHPYVVQCWWLRTFWILEQNLFLIFSEMILFLKNA